MSDIQNITTQINDLSSSISWWNTTIIALMILAAASASGLVIAQFIAFKKAELLSEKQELLIGAKDNQLKSELSEKDVKIAESNRAASFANEAAAIARKTASEATERSVILEMKTEELRSINLEMQVSLTPRMLVLSDLIESRLKKFSGTPFDVQVVAADTEASNFGDITVAVLSKYSWQFGSGSTVHGERFAEGVVVSLRKGSKYLKAASELIAYLEANRAHAILIETDNSPVDRVNIRVGSKVRTALLMPVLHESDRNTFVQIENKNRAAMERLRKEWKMPPYDK